MISNCRTTICHLVETFINCFITFSVLKQLIKVPTRTTTKAYFKQRAVLRRATTFSYSTAQIDV